MPEFKIGDKVRPKMPMTIDGCLVSPNEVGEIVDENNWQPGLFFVVWDHLETKSGDTTATWIVGFDLLTEELEDWEKELTEAYKKSIVQYEKDREDIEGQQE